MMRGEWSAVDWGASRVGGGGVVGECPGWQVRELFQVKVLILLAAGRRAEAVPRGSRRAGWMIGRS